MTSAPHMHAAENELELLLRRAAAEPDLRDAFYHQLLESNILIQAQTEHGNSSVVPAGVEIAVETWVRQDGTSVIPFFSSPEAFFQAVPSGGKCVVMRTYELFESQVGMAFHLNPGSCFGIEFPPGMVDLMLTTRGKSAMRIPGRQGARLQAKTKQRAAANERVLDQIVRSAECASAAVGDAVAYVNASSRKIAQLEKKKR